MFAHFANKKGSIVCNFVRTSFMDSPFTLKNKEKSHSLLYIGLIRMST